MRSMQRCVIEAQAFSGNTLDRGGDDRKAPGFVANALKAADLCIVAGRKLAVVNANSGSASLQLVWLPSESLASAGLALQDDGCLALQPGAQRLPLYLLGREAASGRWKGAIDVGALPSDAALGLAASAAGGGAAVLQELRAAMPGLAPEALAVAGQAVALSAWHTNRAFCGVCGAPTAPIEGGAKRACSATAAHRVYPRVDPVAIMLVESPDGERVLLGRSKKIRAGMYTCLSGFVDQGESIEEAVAREVWEEAGVRVGRVDVIASQPWPVGRGGSCELMIGAVAQARGSDVAVNPHEMDDVRWFSRADMAKAVEKVSAPGGDPFLGGDVVSEDGLHFYIPPPMAIAHHIIKAWVNSSGPWFSKL